MCTFVTSGQVASNTVKPAALRLLLHGSRHSVGAEDHGRTVGYVVELLDEHRAHAAQAIDDEAVVHDLVTHVDRRTEQHDRALDDVDRTVDAGAESARIGEQHLHARCRNASRIRSAAPMVIALSAMLNAGKYAPPQCAWMKSTT